MANPNVGSFLPTTSVWDVSEIYSTDVTSPAFKELLVRLYQNLNNMAVSVNTRDAGFYSNPEFVNGQLFFPSPALNSNTSTVARQRQVFRMVINFGTLPNNATTTKAHGITVTPATSFTRIYGAATNPTSGAYSYLPLPYSSTTDVAHNIELFVDGTNVNIKTGANYSAYTISYVVLEYIKS